MGPNSSKLRSEKGCQKEQEIRERIDDSFARYGASIDAKSKTVASDTDKNWKAAYTFERPGPDQLILDGGVDGHRAHLQERNDFLVELFVKV